MSGDASFPEGCKQKPEIPAQSLKMCRSTNSANIQNRFRLIIYRKLNYGIKNFKIKVN